MIYVVVKYNVSIQISDLMCEYFQVNRDNKSTLAQLVRDSYYSKMCAPDLDGATPLQMLVEIGLEKMCNDYSNAFLSMYGMI